MSLQATIAHALQGVIDRIRRDAIAYAICAVCAIAVLILGTYAAVLALITVVGPVYAPLIVAGGYVLIILLTMLWRQLANAPGQHRAPASPLHVSADPLQAQRQAQFAQLAMIIEAVMLGYSMSRRR
jgi:threonine/homoserine/homoserine lactone efflux protein